MCSRIAADCRSRQAAFGPLRPGVKSPGHDVGSSRSGREHRGGESAPEAGSSAAKPRHRWRVPTKNRHAKARLFGSTCRWKAFWIVEAAPFDEGVGKAVLGASRRVGSSRSGSARGATESVRGSSPAWRAADNAAARWLPPSCGSPRLHPIARATGRSESGRTNRSWRPRRQARSTWGRVALLPSGRGSGLAPQSSKGFGPEDGGGRRGASHALGNQAIHGCSCRESVAEVGEEHLPRVTKGSREANRGGAR
jgi:hypothetical protein